MGSRDMFWGLVVCPGKKYQTEVERPFRVTKACLLPSTAGGKVSSLIVECNNEENFIIANLTQKQFNTTLELSFNEGEKICFKVEGPGTIHLTGNLVPEQDSEDEDIDELEAAAMEADRIKKNIAALPVGGLENDSSDSEEEEEENKIVIKRKITNEMKETNKKAKIEKKDNSLMDSDDDDDDDEEDDDDDDEDSDDDDSDDSDELDTTGLTEEQAKKVALMKKLYEAAKNKVDKEVASSKKADNLPKKVTTASSTSPTTKQKVIKEVASSKKAKDLKEAVKPAKNGNNIEKKMTAANAPSSAPVRTLKEGVKIEDLVVGSGAVAKKGNFVGMYYSGKLLGNKKTFDSCLSGKPFRFRLGSGQVIQGWERGVAGMKEGGKRRLTLAPSMGYGSRGAPPDIPGNATLVFNIECKYVKPHASQERL